MEDIPGQPHHTSKVRCEDLFRYGNERKPPEFQVNPVGKEKKEKEKKDKTNEGIHIPLENIGMK